MSGPQQRRPAWPRSRPPTSRRETRSTEPRSPARPTSTPTSPPSTPRQRRWPARSGPGSAPSPPIGLRWAPMMRGRSLPCRRTSTRSARRRAWWRAPPRPAAAPTLGPGRSHAEGGDVLRRRLEACLASTASGLQVGGETPSRLQILARLSREPDAAARRRLFLALEPLWRVVDGDGLATSPYRVRVRESADAWNAGDSRVASNARALGVGPSAVETWATTILA